MKSIKHFSLDRCAPVALALVLACASGTLSAQALPNSYAQRNLVSDGFITAEHVDPHLINAWGVAFNPFGFVWVADADGMVSTLYDGDGNAASLVVDIPTPTTATGGNPTGIVFNASSGFVVTQNGVLGAARFIFATEQGVIAGWAPGVNGTQAILAVDSSASGASYKGLTLGAGGSGQLLYATDFFNSRVDVFNSSFQPVALPAGAFTDPRLPMGYSPFGIQAIGGNIYVTFGKRNADGEEELSGRGLGYVDVFNSNGHLIRRIASRGRLNAPWGLALAPAGFGAFSNMLLVGNFGDGRINAFDPIRGTPKGTLRGTDGLPIEIEGLWGLQFGNGFLNQPVDTLFFASGPDDEEHGLYGRLDASSGE